tara:strand:- start:487 stop:1065 length:579 start_codon:yes stop_codon:yes gene_type:complete
MPQLELNGKILATQTGSDEAAISSNATFPAGHVIQLVRSSNDLSSITNVTGTSFTQNDGLPYVDITPKQANSQFWMSAMIYGTWGYSIPSLGFCVSTNSGTSYTHQLGGGTDGSGTNWTYSSFMTWGALGDNGGEFTLHYSDLYKSSFTAGQSNIRFAISYRNVYHSSLQNSFGISSSDDNACRLTIFEVAV